MKDRDLIIDASGNVLEGHQIIFPAVAEAG